ncbi:hypothetical protein CSUI_001273 [Cystoisospora suis]|uniref:Uncharacterized protein n=1 Tax=Cystoisospora suis TaxID=483139 RepID=A0A2C6LCA0_9APIC|nr:hypothetical protein CSUI_001273 [Cystoisospora suis]
MSSDDAHCPPPSRHHGRSSLRHKERKSDSEKDHSRKSSSTPGPTFVDIHGNRIEAPAAYPGQPSVMMLTPDGKLQPISGSQHPMAAMGGGVNYLPASSGATLVPSAGGTMVPPAGATMVPSAGATVVPSNGATVVPSAGATVVPSAGATLAVSDQSTSQIVLPQMLLQGSAPSPQHLVVQSPGQQQVTVQPVGPQQVTVQPMGGQQVSVQSSGMQQVMLDPPGFQETRTLVYPQSGDQSQIFLQSVPGGQQIVAHQGGGQHIVVKSSGQSLQTSPSSHIILGSSTQQVAAPPPPAQAQQPLCSRCACSMTAPTPPPCCSCYHHPPSEPQIYIIQTPCAPCCGGCQTQSQGAPSHCTCSCGQHQTQMAQAQVCPSMPTTVVAQPQGFPQLFAASVPGQTTTCCYPVNAPGTAMVSPAGPARVSIQGGMPHGVVMSGGGMVMQAGGLMLPGGGVVPQVLGGQMPSVYSSPGFMPYGSQAVMMQANPGGEAASSGSIPATLSVAPSSLAALQGGSVFSRGGGARRSAEQDGAGRGRSPLSGCFSFEQ